MRVLSVHHGGTYGVLLTGLILCGLFFAAPVAFAGTVSFSPVSGTYEAGETFMVTVIADPQGDAVYAVDARLTFDMATLVVTNVAKADAFSVWTKQPTFSNATGVIEFGGGSPNAFTEPTDLAIITFRALTHTGTASVSVVSASMRSADTLGADAYSGSTDAHYTIIESSTGSAEATDEADSASVDTPVATSSVFSDPEAWYAANAGAFTWEVPSSVARIAFDVSTSSDAEPQTPYEPPIETAFITPDMLTEGTQYFMLQYKYPDGWGPVYRHALRIDTVPPDPFAVQVYSGSASSTFPLLAFEAHDETSGVRAYTVYIDDIDSATLTPEEARNGYMLRDLVDGIYEVRVVAEDHAGNTREASVSVSVAAGWQPPIDDTSSPLSSRDLVILVLLLALIGQWFMIARARRRQEVQEARIRKETQEIQGQMEKIFSALRDEIYEQINSITKRKRLSKKEKEVVESLDQALQISETLIEKEILDVDKVLKKR